MENELGERWAIYMDPLEIRQHRIKVRQELFDVEEKRSRMLRRIADIRTRLPKARGETLRLRMMSRPMPWSRGTAGSQVLRAPKRISKAFRS